MSLNGIILPHYCINFCTLKVSAILKGVPDQLGRKTIYIRTSSGIKRTFKATTFKVHPRDWNGKVKSTVPNYSFINDAVRIKIYEAEYLPVTYPNIDLHAYTYRCLNDWDREKRGSTLTSNRSEAKMLKKYCGPVLLSEINLSWLNAYKSYCLINYKPNTAWRKLTFLKTVIKKAFKEKLIRENPFDSFKMPSYKDPHKIYLTESQIKFVEKFSEKPGPLQLVATWFVIGCYTGLRYSDMKSFNKSKIRGGRLTLYTTKTGEPVSLKLNPELIGLFKRAKSWPQTYQTFRAQVKELREALKFSEPITPHTSRHSFGALCAAKGIPQEVAMKFMGIKEAKTIAIYYHLAGTTLDNEYRKLF